MNFCVITSRRDQKSATIYLLEITDAVGTDVHEDIIRLIASRIELEPVMETRTTNSWTSRSLAQLYMVDG